MRRYTVFFGVVWVIAITVILGVQVLDHRAKADNATEQSVSSVIDALDTYYIGHNQMPASLQNLDSSIATSGLVYTKQSDTSYKLCASYHKQKTDIEGDLNKSNEVTLSETTAPQSHPAGRVCYTYGESDARLLNEAAKEQTGSNCTNLKQTSYQSEPGKITNLDLKSSTVMVGSDEFTLCKDVVIQEKNGTASYSTDGFNKLKLGNSIIVQGSDKGHITSVNVQ